MGQLNDNSLEKYFEKEIAALDKENAKIEELETSSLRHPTSRVTRQINMIAKIIAFFMITTPINQHEDNNLVWFSHQKYK